MEGLLNYIVSCSLESRLLFDLYLGRDITTQQSILLEVRKLGDAYLEGCFKSNKYGSGFLMNNVIVYIVLKLLIMNVAVRAILIVLHVYMHVHLHC